MSAKALNAILPLIASSPYEAHQKARTFASRYNKSGQHDTAIDVLFQSARDLLKAGQTGSGIDLAGFLLDIYDTKGEAVTDESRGRLTQLIALTGSQGSWRKTLIDKSIAWSSKHGTHPAGDPDLQHYVGELLYKDGAFVAAEPHLLAAGKRESAKTLAEMYIQWAAGSSPGPFALRGTIPYLISGNVLAARTFIIHFTSHLPEQYLIASSSPISVASSPTGLPTDVVLTKDTVVNFSQMAVLTCQRAQGDKNKAMREAWVRLCGTYLSKGGLLATPEVRKYLNDIATLYFAMPPPRAQAANPLGDMMSSFFGGPAPAPPTRRVLKPPSAPVPDAGLD
ncbi:hypothetical protein HGRIS_000952 [Hohenbuehelia grisea]|uniref:Cytoplasmic protein n=1 Tax=Hohenbuehelia grisea TaxID=104357 RepID=A0ABR3IQA1_9AGAR